ncbi:MAG: galactokinase [Lachnospiraceae bacterium]|nr:galactokinase [Lachnospiraceae bacterium]
MKDQLISKFTAIFGEQETKNIKTYFAPGRVNLIGEHTDYNGGHVFPCALTLGTYAVVRKRDDKKIRFYSMNFEEMGMIESFLNDFVYRESASWTNYLKGVIWTFEKRGYKIPTGFDVLIYGNIPNGAGLSSSASLEVVTGLMLKDLFGFQDLSMLEIALIGQYSENNFNGMNCGIMDQFASALGKKDHAIFLDTNTLIYEYVPIKLKDAKIVITNSKVKHSLVDTKYNERRRECEAAVKELQSVTEIESLGELTEEQYQQFESAISDSVLKKRANHAVYENQRTLRAVQALKNKDITSFGQLMNASHESLKYNYEVSCEEIDLLVELAQSIDGVLGSRITGGGFGGCTVSIVKEEAIYKFKQLIGEQYEKRTGHIAEFYVVDIGDGAHAI